MNKNNDFDDLNEEFNQLSKNLKNVLDSLTKKIESFEENTIETSDIIELIESYKKRIIEEEE
tara:strand:+ start:155 stop:340 length:186 start_codon:yes stop_codon:yes gene_type:complete